MNAAKDFIAVIVAVGHALLWFAFDHGWPRALFIIAVLVAARLFWVFCLGGKAIRKNRARVLAWRIKLRMRPSTGYASTAHLLYHWSRFAAVHFTSRTRPDTSYFGRMFSPSSRYAAPIGRAQYFKRVWINPEDQTVYIAPPRTAKTMTMADRGLYHDGPWLVTSTRDDIARLTGGIRARKGPVFVFNPQNVGSIPSNFAWNPIIGCLDPETALRRAQHCMGPMGDGDMRFWMTKGTAALAALFHAADILNNRGVYCDMSTVWQWVNRYHEEDVADALRYPEATASLLPSFMEIAKDGKQADSIRITMSQALEWVMFPNLLEMTCGQQARSFDFASFLHQRGTVYLIAKGGSDTGAAALFRMFAGECHHAAGIAGSRTQWSKLSPPFLMSLDEVTQICQVPLDKWLADSAGWGIQMEFVIHDYAQLEGVWGVYEAKVIWGLCGTKIVLPGLQNPETCERLSTMIGRVNTMKDDSEHIIENIQIAPPEFIRQLPDWRALIVRRNRAVTVVKVRPIFRRLRYRADKWVRRTTWVWTLTGLERQSRKVLVPALRIAAISPGVTRVLPPVNEDMRANGLPGVNGVPVQRGDGPGGLPQRHRIEPGTVEPDVEDDQFTIPADWLNGSDDN